MEGAVKTAEKTKFKIKCSVCGWEGRLEADGSDEALKEGMTRHIAESREKDGAGEWLICANETFAVCELKKESVFFVSCQACGFMTDVKAEGPIQALKAGAGRHSKEGDGCKNRKLEVEGGEEGETKYVG